MLDPITRLPSDRRQTGLTFRSELASVEQIEALAESWAKSAGFDPEIASQIAMVAREAAINAVFHGNHEDSIKVVTTGFEIADGALTIRVADQGAGLDASTIPDPLTPENILRSSGRGVFLMRALMDEVSFRNLEPGTEITLVKRLPG